ncbi:CVNH domain-containing protein [Photobacterium alginatilyticum]|uniref:Cyanovirin n=1 Tax=Photobacterium alginatilyticum TaxID=1775171 RepID=A0ABW9YQQ6_9GAMM|nr:CVNH domain-containing protein [Photobacterium alginatilyticum]NBI56258.1 cyanovirin [Photobacterium alginatilyticum]
MSQYVPEGSFIKTSRNVKSVLYATARKRNQSYVPSALDITELNSADVANLDGVLVSQTNHGAPSGYVPSGSYKETCRDVRVILSAECKKIDGSWQYSTLELTDISNVSISNIDGVLKIDN